MKRIDILKGKPSPLAIKRARNKELQKELDAIKAQCLSEGDEYVAITKKEAKMAAEFLKRNKKLDINKNIWLQLNE